MFCPDLACCTNLSSFPDTNPKLGQQQRTLFSVFSVPTWIKQNTVSSGMNGLLWYWGELRKTDPPDWEILKFDLIIFIHEFRTCRKTALAKRSINYKLQRAFHNIKLANFWRK
jgi:hypothetical protein